MANVRPIRAVRQKPTHLQHIRENPSDYIGLLEPVNENHWIYEANTTDENDNTTHSKGRMIKQEITYVPGLYKIFNEILMNSFNHSKPDQKVTEIRIDIDVGKNSISIRNNGSGIGFFEQDEKTMLEILFGLSGSLLTTNYNQHVGGAALTNIFSDFFKVQTVSNKAYYERTWENNVPGKTKTHPVSFDDLTKVTFRPELKKFNMMKLDDNDTIKLMERRVYDVSINQFSDQI